MPERRLTGFFLIEGEAAHYDLSQIQDVQERLVRKMCADSLQWRWSDLQELGADTDKLLNLTIPFERITYTEAIRILHRKQMSIQWGEDLKAEHEILLGQHVGRPFFVTHYPNAIKFFNMKSDPLDPRIALSSDLLMPGYGEVAGASEREDNYDKLKANLKHFAQDEKRIEDMKRLGIQGSEELELLFQWYLDLRKHPGISTSGFGLGVERLVQWVCGFESIMDAIEYPKNMYRLGP